MPGRKPARRSSALVPVTTSAMPSRAASGRQDVDQLGLAERAAVAGVGAVALAGELVGARQLVPDAERRRRSAAAAARSAAGRLGETAVAATTRSVPSVRTAAASTRRSRRRRRTRRARRAAGRAAPRGRPAGRRACSRDGGCHGAREADGHPGGRSGVLDERDQPAVRARPRPRAPGCAGRRDPLAVDRARVASASVRSRRGEDGGGGVGQRRGRPAPPPASERGGGLLDRAGAARRRRGRRRCAAAP